MHTHTPRSSRSGLPRQSPRTRDRLGKELPKVLFISCTESRLAPQRFVAHPDQIYEVRNIGNIVLPYNPRIVSGDIATIEYTLTLPNLSDVVISGHSGCTAVAALLAQKSVSSSMRRWLFVGNSRAASREAVGARIGAVLDAEACERAARAHLLTQLANLAGYPGLESGRRGGDLRLRALFHSSETGATDIYSPRANSFVPLTHQVAGAAR
ncbi:carbonic anhydrase [Streptomyces sp. NPDC017988]|uniref:carbonic anhydrase n=1 Tax=Streptomyces sp. NPDC017988 TaxID=3365025 RepID=UPI0037AA6E5C